MDQFLRALQGGQLPAGIRSVLGLRFGAEVVAGLIDAGLLTPGAPATRYPWPRGGSSGPREIIDDPGDADFPFVAIPPGTEVCCPSVRLTAADLVSWRTSRRALVATLIERFAVRGPANLRDEVFPCAHRIGRAAWRGIDREVLICTDLNGAAPLAFLLARHASHQPTLILAHARTPLHLTRRRDALRLGASLTHPQARACAELMERRKPLRAGELEALNSYGSPDKQIEAARRAIDVKISRYEWRSTKLLRGDDRRAKRYLFQPPEGLRWVLLTPIEDRS